MNEQIEQVTEQPARRKPTKKRAKSRRPEPKTEQKPFKATGEYEGITGNSCCTNCTAERCVITTVALCGHPYKGSLPNAGPKTKARIMDVKKLLKHQKIEAAG